MIDDKSFGGWIPEIEDLKKTITKLETAHGRNMREIDRLNAELAAAKANTEFMTGELRSATNTSIDRTKERDALKGAYFAILKQNDALRAELAAERERVGCKGCPDLAARAELAAEREKTAELQEWLKENGQTIGEFVASNKEAWDRAHKAEAERDRLRAELAAANEEKRQALIDANELLLDVKNSEAKVDGYRAAIKIVEAERDEARAELAARDALLREARDKLQPVSALVDMTPSGFPDHDICPIRLGMARDLRELRARIDAALAKGGGDE